MLIEDPLHRLWCKGFLINLLHYNFYWRNMLNIAMLIYDFPVMWLRDFAVIFEARLTHDKFKSIINRLI